MIPFEAKLQPQQEVKNFADVLANEAGEAIMAWVISGAYQYIQAGHKLVIPAFVQNAIDRYRNDNDWMGEFLDEFCEVRPEGSVGAKSLYTTYHNWATVVHGYARRIDAFNAEMEKRGFVRRKTNVGFV